MTNNTTVGSYTAFSCEIDNDARAAFAEAFENFVGVRYEPVAVSTQVVAGTNYAFFCNATLAYPGSTPYPAMVNIFQSLEGKSSITHIEKLAF
ncbi:MAG: hypothetical protein ACRBHB_04625 [Arenicella sp.]